MPTNAIFSQQYTHHSNLWSKHNPNYQNQSSPVIKETIEKTLKISKVISQRFVETIFQNIPSSTDEALIIDLSSIRLDVKGITTLADKLSQTPNITKLILSNTTLPDFALKILVKSILIQGKIEILDISYNRITSIGAEEIANLIRESKSIQFINASYNMLDYEGHTQNNGLKQILTALKSKSGIHFNHTTDYTEEIKEFITESKKTHKAIQKYAQPDEVSLEDLTSSTDDNSNTDSDIHISGDNAEPPTESCHCVML